MTLDQCYHVLGVAPGVTEEQLRTAYRRQAMLHHPDRNNGSPEAAARFRELTEAYETLRGGAGRGNSNDDLLVAFRDLVQAFMTLLNER